MVTTVAVMIVLAGVLGVLLTAATLPGTWLNLAAAAGAQWWYWATHGHELMFSWWTLGIALGLALIAEIVELAASAVGAQRAGGSKRGAMGSIVGGLVGAVVGTFVVPIPILGTIIGAAVGAGVGALVVERGVVGKGWRHSTRIGAGAAVGRLVATIAKTGFAVAIALMLAIDAFV